MKPKPLEVFPGEKGFTELVPNANFDIVGNVTQCRYRFKSGKKQYVDKRDLPKLPRDRFYANTGQAGQGAQESAELDGDS